MVNGRSPKLQKEAIRYGKQLPQELVWGKYSIPSLSAKLKKYFGYIVPKSARIILREEIFI